MSIQEVKSYVGVDVASKHLDLFDASTGKAERVKNDADSIEEICQKWKGRLNAVFVMEASGGYESLLVSKLEQADIPRAVVNARRVREFARSMGADAKTDEIDAKVIAQFAAVLKPVLTSTQSEEERKHAALVTRRSQLVNLITQEKNRLKQTWDTDAKKSVQKVLDLLGKESKVAIVACMRKFITTLNYLIKTDQLWETK